MNLTPTKSLPLWKPVLWFALAAVGWSPVIIWAAS